MQLIAIITEEQKDKLVGQTIQPGWFFNPVKDGNDNWIISKEEMRKSGLNLFKQQAEKSFNPCLR